MFPPCKDSGSKGVISGKFRLTEDSGKMSGTFPKKGVGADTTGKDNLTAGICFHSIFRSLDNGTNHTAKGESGSFCRISLVVLFYFILDSGQGELRVIDLDFKEIFPDGLLA